MLESINWTTIILSMVGSLGSGGMVLAGALVAWGRIQERVRSHQQRLDLSNGKLDDQSRKDSEIEVKLSKIHATCAERYELLMKNDREHVEIFSRVHSLETGLAALPGKIIEQMDARFKDWRTSINSDIRNTIYAIDREREHDRRRQIRRDYNPGRRESNGHAEAEEGE